MTLILRLAEVLRIDPPERLLVEAKRVPDLLLPALLSAHQAVSTAELKEAMKQLKAVILQQRKRGDFGDEDYFRSAPLIHPMVATTGTLYSETPSHLSPLSNAPFPQSRGCRRSTRASSFWRPRSVQRLRA
jgi:hypothetical protein